MKPNASLPDFAARLRRLIRASPVSLTETGFNSLALELFALQFQRNAPYRRICAARNLSPEEVSDWSRIPAVPASAFKELDLSCLSPADRTTVFYSSGTTAEQRSRHFHNEASLALYQDSLMAWFEANVVDGSNANRDRRLCLLTPGPSQAPHSSLVHMFEAVRLRLGSPPSAFVGRASPDGGWSLDFEAAVAALEDAVRSPRPLLVVGTAFMFVRLLDRMAEVGLALQLPTGSSAMETGGYKGRSRALPAGELHALITRGLGIPAARILREYGMCELSSQAYAGPPGAADDLPLLQDAPGSFHFPPWARARIVSPETGREVAEGEAGLIRIFDLANVFSVLAVQTEDLGVRRGGGFDLLGRSALAEPRGCSLMTA